MRPKIGGLLLGLGLSASCDDYISTSSGGTGSGNYTADWASVQSFFESECNSCHSTTPPLLPDSLATDITDGTGYWVVPGSSADSALWRVLADALIEGDFDVMPFGTGPLPLEDVQFVQEWIDAGASLE